MPRIAFLLIVWLAAACGGKKICPYKPSPIFEEGLPHIEDYSYEAQGEQSREAFMTDRGIFVEIYQEVCEKTRQEYRFTAPGEGFLQMPDSIWLKEASRELVFLSSFSEKQAPLKQWADLIETSRPDIRMGQETELNPGIFVKVNKVAAADKGMLIVELFQK
ncbi:MAG: hypothetical protein IT259_08845 [Saprospiraceae bacterium]|nr:hypothetical protein [Saprospiraceae bacterium]